MLGFQHWKLKLVMIIILQTIIVKGSVLVWDQSFSVSFLILFGSISSGFEELGSSGSMPSWSISMQTIWGDGLRARSEEWNDWTKEK